jgi:hypothetical protein
MAGPYDPEEAAVRVSTTLTGTYTIVGLVTSSSFTEGSSGTSETPYMGGIAYKSGRSTVNGTVNYLFNRADTNGQEVIRAAKRSGASVFLQDCPEGTAVGDKVEQVEAKIDEVGRESDAGNDWVTGSFTFTGIASTLTTETLSA